MYRTNSVQDKYGKEKILFEQKSRGQTVRATQTVYRTNSLQDK